MYTIKQAARLTGVTEATLRAWERRYGVVVPVRNGSGYRVYDDGALAAVAATRRLVDEGWSPAAAANAVRAGTVPMPAVAVERPDGAKVPERPDAAAAGRLFLASAGRMDTAGVEASLDQGFALGSFEHVVDSWLFPALRALGEGWARGDIDVAGEHAASQAVHRRLTAAFAAAGSRARGPSVVVGLPPGGRHELGALAFATAIRRLGLDVLYLGADVPAGSWEAAVRSRAARAAVLSVSMPQDRPAALAAVRRLRTCDPAPLVCGGGAHGATLPDVLALGPGIDEAARQLDELLDDGAGRIATHPAR